MSTDDKAPEATTPNLGIHPAASAPETAQVAPEPVSDPILALIERREASDTQAFMAKMSAANIAEFAERKRKARWVRIGLAVTVALVGVVLIGIGLAGGL